MLIANYKLEAMDVVENVNYECVALDTIENPSKSSKFRGRTKQHRLLIKERRNVWLKAWMVLDAIA